VLAELGTQLFKDRLCLTIITQGIGQPVEAWKRFGWVAFGQVLALLQHDHEHSVQGVLRHCARLLQAFTIGDQARQRGTRDRKVTFRLRVENKRVSP
jgi:hypothetical protein